MANTMVDESLWQEAVRDAVWMLAASGEPFTCDDVRKLVREAAPSERDWSSIWRFTSDLQVRVPGAGDFSRRPEARGHMLTVRRGRPEVIAAAQEAA